MNIQNIPDNFINIEAFSAPKPSKSQKIHTALPENLALTYRALPTLLKTFKPISLPLALFLNPLYSGTELIKVSTHTNSRLCNNCGAYLNPYCVVKDTRWICSICNYSKNDCDCYFLLLFFNYILIFSINTLDHGALNHNKLIPELQQCTIDYPAPRSSLVILYIHA